MADSNMTLIETLIEEHNHDPKALLESLVRALPSRVVIDHLEWVSDQEDWTFKVNADGAIYDSEKAEVET